ncbi:MAG TPA: hypothetical protein VF233_11145 [Nitrososphaeraceae archaeon]
MNTFLYLEGNHIKWLSATILSGGNVTAGNTTGSISSVEDNLIGEKGEKYSKIHPVRT